MHKSAVIYIIIAIVFNTFIPSFVYSCDSKQCFCCAKEEGHNNPGCHGAQDVCICKHFRIVQAILPEASNLLYYSFSGYLNQALQFSYRYLSVDDTFHPPKV